MVFLRRRNANMKIEPRQVWRCEPDSVLLRYCIVDINEPSKLLPQEIGMHSACTPMTFSEGVNPSRVTLLKEYEFTV